MNTDKISDIEKCETENFFDPQHRKVIHAIIAIIKEDHRGLTITDIAERTGLNRNTVRKYALILTGGGYIEERSCGHTKVFTISNRVALTSVLDYAKEGILIIDENNEISYFNAAVSKELELERKYLDLLLGDNEVQKALSKAAITGITEKNIVFNAKKNSGMNLNMRFVPVNCFDGGKKTVIYITHQK